MVGAPGALSTLSSLNFFLQVTRSQGEPSNSQELCPRTAWRGRRGPGHVLHYQPRPYKETTAFPQTKRMHRGGLPSPGSHRLLGSHGPRIGTQASCTQRSHTPQAASALQALSWGAGGSGGYGD